MLNYNIKIGGDNLKKEELVWSERYLSPDLSFISGVTSQDYHLEKLTQIEGAIDGKSDLLNIECENVIREGYIVVKNKRYTAISTNNAILINGKYYYIKDGKITVDNWLSPIYDVKERNGETIFVPNVSAVTVTASVAHTPNSTNYASLDTVYWIENGKVNIDGNEYFFDRNERRYYETNSSDDTVVQHIIFGGLKYFENGPCLNPEEVTSCTGIDYYPIKDASDFIHVTKFKLIKNETTLIEKDNITFCNHLFFVKYGGKYYPIDMVKVNEDDEYYTYQCDIDGTKYDVILEGGSTATTTNVSEIEDLYNNYAYITLGDGCNIPVDNMLQNSNYGKKIGIYITDTNANINVGNIITAKKTYLEGDDFTVETINGKLAVQYRGSKYDVVDGLMSTVVINGVEYNIVRCDDTNCFVDIDGEELPMKKDGNDKLERYGLIIKDADSAETATYNINDYSGVTINGKTYRVIVNADDNYVVYPEDSMIYTLRVLETVGSSLFVCEPDLNASEFGDDYIKNASRRICEELVNNQHYYQIYIDTPLFGSREVLPGNGKIYNSEAVSTDDFQNVTDNLILYTQNGYIEIPLKLDASIEMNALIDDTRDIDFVDVETQKAINPIVDMDRDMYVPKYIDNSPESIQAYTAYCSTNGITQFFPTGMKDDDKKHAYIGSFTDFKPITEIQINPHFRTRNLESWKVNDSNYDISTANLDNWFVTDYEPYKSFTDKDKLMEVADTLGLLWFTNMDVYYQKSALGKSFLRLTYYDDTNPQTQTLLHNSTVFMDEHDLYKRFIDNSRKNVNKYIYVQESSENPTVLNKISVMSEYATGDTFGDAVLTDESKRVSSRFTIKNKYETDTSSEGFYLYIFKEYAENLHPKPIYMKVDFNHAKIGKIIPFIIPMSSTTKDGSSYAYPVTALTFAQLDKEGIPLSYVYGQGYIPLYAMYDFKNKEYGYVFDDRYVKVENGIAKLNLFELKIKNEESGAQQEKTFKIDINEKQILVK